MTIYSIIFYLLALLILGSTAMAITRRNLVHAVIYLIFSFFGSAMLFYLFGAPFLAVLEVIIYAGAIMVLFLFIVIMMRRNRRRALVSFEPVVAGCHFRYCLHRHRHGSDYGRTEQPNYLENSPGRARVFGQYHF